MSTSIPDFKLGVASDPTPGFGSDVTLAPSTVTAEGATPTVTLQYPIANCSAVNNQSMIVKYKLGILPEGPALIRLISTATSSIATLENSTGASVYLLSKTGGFSTVPDGDPITSSTSGTAVLVYRIAENMFLAL